MKGDAVGKGDGVGFDHEAGVSEFDDGGVFTYARTNEDAVVPGCVVFQEAVQEFQGEFSGWQERHDRGSGCRVCWGGFREGTIEDLQGSVNTYLGRWTQDNPVEVNRWNLYIVAYCGEKYFASCNGPKKRRGARTAPLRIVFGECGRDGGGCEKN